MEIAFDLPTSPDAAGTARSELMGLGGALSAALLADVLLVVSELVTNAVRHGPGGQVRVRVRVDGREQVQGEVIDPGDAVMPDHPVVRADGGWGLQLVDALASRWGVTEGSTRVWFEITHS